MEKSIIKRFKGHFYTITKHKILVTKLCFKCGMYKQGLLHDLSKYSLIEFFSGVKYYQGNRSPIDAEKEDKGYSLGWLHHEGRNKHHFEYWIDKDYNTLTLRCLDMPLNYLIESTLDRIAASKVYNPYYTQKAPLDFFENGKDRYFMGYENARRYRFLLNYLAQNGEEKALEYYTELYKEWRKDHNKNI